MTWWPASPRGKTWTSLSGSWTSSWRGAPWWAPPAWCIPTWSSPTRCCRSLRRKSAAASRREGRCATSCPMPCSTTSGIMTSMDDRNVWRSRAAALAEASLSRPRLMHSREVARLASELCDRFHADEEKGYIAGISHDLARELDVAEMLLLAEKDGLPLRDWERSNPLLLHGRAAAAILTKHTGYVDEEALQ